MGQIEAEAWKLVKKKEDGRRKSKPDLKGKELLAAGVDKDRIVTPNAGGINDDTEGNKKQS